MVILGIADSHEAHACLLKSGKIVAAIAEERLTRLKQDAGYPYKSINEILKLAKIKSEDIDLVAFAGFTNGLFNAITKPNATFTIEDWIYQNENYWKPKLIENKKLNHIDEYLLWEKKKPEMKKNIYYKFVKEAKKNPPKFHHSIFNKIRKETVVNHLKIDPKKVIFFRHENCHQYYGYYSQPKIKKNCLIFTLEGGGDDSSATISVVKNYKIKEKYKTNDAMIARLYRYITLLLGMKPAQHEYKVMGLAPYGQKYHGEKSLKHFRKYNSIVGIKFKKLNFFKDVYYSSREHLLGQRFDGIAWGIQKYTEEIVSKWIKNSINKFKLKNIIFSGGVAQNVKALKELFYNPKLKSIWAGPTSGDGSLAIGAVWLASKKFDKKNKIEGLKSIYLGTSVQNKEIKKIIATKCKSFKIIRKVTSKQIAIWISRGLVIARCSGRMEFGQRALGNRSILADPRNFKSIERINSKIKYRDFWMPFAPTVLYESCSKFLKNPKKIYSPYMTIAFDINPGIENKIPGVIHPADKTVRPQMLKKSDNPEYYDIIKNFSKITNIPVMLNTSFNLHGDAIVENAHQAFDTFKKSDIDILILNNYAIIRRLKV